MPLITFDKKRIENLVAGVAFILAFLVVGYLLVIFHDRNENVAVLAAAVDIEKFGTLKYEDIKEVLIPRGKVPGTALIDRKSAVGRIVSHKFSPNQVITTNDLYSEKLDPKSDAQLVPGNLNAFVLLSGWLSSPLPRVKKNDVLTILMTMSHCATVEEGTQIAIDSAPILAVYDNSESLPQKILLGLTAEQIAFLTQARANGLILTPVVASHDQILNRVGKYTQETKIPVEVNEPKVQKQPQTPPAPITPVVQPTTSTQNEPVAPDGQPIRF